MRNGTKRTSTENALSSRSTRSRTAGDSETINSDEQNILAQDDGRTSSTMVIENDHIQLDLNTERDETLPNNLLLAQNTTDAPSQEAQQYPEHAPVSTVSDTSTTFDRAVSSTTTALVRS